MLKVIEQVGAKEKLSTILDDIDVTSYFVLQDRRDYQKYKENREIRFTPKRKRDMQILELLERLGFPMDKAGTYLYKELIAYVCSYLQDVETRDDIKSCVSLIQELKDGHSGTYFDIARNDLDLGLSSYHRIVGIAQDNVDYTKVDPILLQEIYGRFSRSLDYGEQAFLLGAYVTGKLVPREPKNFDFPKIKKLEEKKK